MIVNRPKPVPASLIVAFRAMPVTIPGRAIGRTRTNDTVSRPKNRKRCTASAARLPSTIASAVAANAACNDSANASRTDSLAMASANQLVVSAPIGQVCERSALNEYRTMIPMGR